MEEASMVLGTATINFNSWNLKNVHNHFLFNKRMWKISRNISTLKG